MTKFAMVSLYIVGGLVVFFAAAGIVYSIVKGDGHLTGQAIAAFASGAVFVGIGSIIELLRKIAGKS